MVIVYEPPRRRRIGCKKTRSKRRNLPPLKKEILAEELQGESVSISGIRLPVSHQKEREEVVMSDAVEQRDNEKAEGEESDPDTAESRFSAEPHDENEDEEASDAESMVDSWSCRVCRKAVVSIAVVPCSHLCLCWDCESETDKCPVCAGPKAGVFYIRTD